MRAVKDRDPGVGTGGGQLSEGNRDPRVGTGGGVSLVCGLTKLVEGWGDG